jgi:CheY-like chemotaxis protein
MDGYEALSGIRQQSPHIPVLLISGYASSYRSAVNEDYFTEFLTKPFAAADLENRLSLMGVNAAINS